jgi:hypothetical protein
LTGCASALIANLARAGRFADSFTKKCVGAAG